MRQVSIGSDDTFLLVDIANSLRKMAGRPEITVADYVATVPDDTVPPVEEAPEKTKAGRPKKKEETGEEG